VLKSWSTLAAIPVFVLTILGAGAAWAEDKPIYAPPAKWVQVAPIPAAPDDPQAAAIQVLLDDNQAMTDAQGIVAYNRRVVRIVKPEGLAGSGSRSATWDPARERLTLHGLTILRGGQVIDLLAGGKDVLVLRREKNLERAMLDGRMTASIQLKDLQVGDVVDWSYSLQHSEPMLGGRSNDTERMSWPGVAGRYRVRLLWPDGLPLTWKTTTGFPAPRISTTGKTQELLVDVAGVSVPKPPAGAPGRFQRLGELQATTYVDWSDVSRRMAPLYAQAATLKVDSPLKAEAATIAAASQDPKRRAFAALKLVEDKTRYLFLGMGDGGYRPAPADETWARRFGDCKGKTVLLLALLRELGIEAEPVLVSMGGGDGLDARVASAAQFNHVLVRARIAGTDYWLDGTRTGDAGGLDALRPPGFQWGLPVREAGAKLEPIVQPPLTKPDSDTVLRFDASAGLDAPAPTTLTMTTRGDKARSMARMIETVPRADLERTFKQGFSSSMSWITLDTVDWTVAPDGEVALVFTGKADLDWALNDDIGAREFRLPGSGDGQVKTFPRREPGPDSDAPYAVGYPSFSRTVTEIVLPGRGAGFSVKGPNGEMVLAGSTVHQASTLTDGVARFERTSSSQAREIPFAAAEESNKLLRKSASEAKIVRAPKAP
jgi:transglutaminase-like putative cysteine protease